MQYLHNSKDTETNKHHYLSPLIIDIIIIHVHNLNSVFMYISSDLDPLQAPQWTAKIQKTEDPDCLLGKNKDILYLFWGVVYINTYINTSIVIVSSFN